MADYPIDSIKPGASELVFTTHVRHQELFYVHVDSRAKILEDIMDKLATRYMNLGPADKILVSKRVGTLCAAKFTDDDNWYRAKITGVMGNGLIEVQFVDYGNTDYVGEDRLKALDPDLVQYPIQCYRCALADVSCAQGFWTPELMVQFEDKVLDKGCRAVFRSKRELDEVYLVEMYGEDGDYINGMFGAQHPTVHVPSGGRINPPNQEGGFKETVWGVGTKIIGTVIYSHSPSHFWCQDTAYVNNIFILSETLSRLHMTQDIKPLTKVSSGTVCAAKFSEDEAWYRGIVQSVSANSAQIFFVDYGNSESVSLEFVCNLKPEMMELPALAVKCCLSNVSLKSTDNNPDVQGLFDTLVGDKELEVKVVSKQGDTHHVTLFDIVENKDIGSQLQPLLGKKVDPPKKEAALNVSSDDDSAAAPIMPVGSKVNVFLSWVENPGNFWVQQQDAKDQLDIMTEQIQEFYSRPQPIAPSSPGGFIVVRCPDDQMWYRGLVLKELEDDLVAVLYLDYGNSDILPKCELRHVKPEFGKIIPLATRCALSGVRPLRKGDLSWTNDAKDFLEKMTEKGCNCEVVGQTDSHRLVKLTVGNKDVSKELVALRVVSDASPSVMASHGSFYTNKIHLEKSQKEMVTVSHVDSPKSFWCLLSKFSGALNDLMDKLSMHYSDEGGTPLREPAVGQACIVQSKEDSAWYRAAVVKTLATGYEVHLVDYGSNEVLQCNVVCQPEPRFLDLPMQAIHCSLSVGADTDNIDAFCDLVLEKDLELEVIDFSNDVVIVELYDSKKKISQMLKASSMNQEQNRKQTSVMHNLVLAPAKTPALNYPIKVFISWVVSPSKFFLQENGIDEALESLMDRIAKKYDNSSKVAPLSNPQVGHPCVGLYSEDSLWYRGLITSVSVNQCKVLFVDYGNEETIGVEDVRTMLPEIASVPIMAIQCSLSGTEETTWSTSAIEFFETLVMDQEMECIFVTPTVVKLKNSGQDIVSQLVTAGFCKSSTVEMSATQRKLTNEASPWTSPIKQDGGSGRFGGQDDKGKRFNNITKGESDNYDGGHGEKSREFGSRGFSGAPREDSLCISESRGFGKFGGQHEDKRNGGGNRNERDIAFGGREKTSGLRHDDFGSSGRQEIKPSSDSASSSSGPREELSYPDPPAEPEQALLTHMDDDGTFYIQLLSMEKDILFLSKRMAGSYKNGGGPRLKETPVKGSVCCAKFPLDGGMYRCVVEDVQGGNVVLRYVDYGNVTESSARDLKMLFADLLQLPVLAFPCKLRGLNWSVQQAEKFAKATLEKKLMVNFLTNTARPYEVDVETPEGDLLGILTGKVEPPADIISPKASSAVKEATSPQKGGFGEKKTSVKSPGGFGTSASVKPSSIQSPAFEKSTPSVPKQEFLPQTSPVGENQAYITHLDQDGYFYLQLEKDTAFLESFSGVMDANSNLKHPNISVGAACAAVFSEDSAWYRAIICAVADATIQVKFVDYGNGDSVSPSLIAPLSSQLLASAPLAYQCQFLGMGPLSIEASAKLSESYMEHPLTVVFTGTSAPYDVKITTSDGQDLQEILCPSNSYRPKPVPKEVIPTVVCHIEDNGHFYLQLYKDYKDIAELQICLSAFYNTEPVKSVEKPETGLPCTVKDSDGVWLRSQILQISDTSATIRHVDTGKSTSVELSSLLALESQFLKQPPFALECCLNDVADRWNESLRAKFTDMTQGKVLNATFHTTTLPLRVSLTRSIELDLLDLAAPILDIPVKTAFVPDSPVKTATVPDSPVKTSLIPDSHVKTELISDCSLKTAVISDIPVKTTPVSDSPVNIALISDSPVKTALIPESPSSSTSETNVSKLLTSNSGADGGLSDKMEVYIPHVEADGTFYIQLVAMEDSLNELADKLEGMEVTTLSQVTIGDTVCAKFTEDNVWYRATVESCNPDNQYTVRFVDFGNTDVVNADRLAALSSDLSTSIIPPFTTRCQQTNIPLSVVAAATEQIKELVNNEVVSVKFVTKVSDVQEVDVTIGGKSIVELLDLNVEETQFEVNHEQLVTSDVTESQLKNINTNNSADPDGITSQTSSLLSNISAGQRVTVTVICAVSPDEFYLHLDKDKSGLDTLMNEMYDYFSDMPEEQGLVMNLSVGDVCAALYEDESWYRVRILENLNGTYQVFYIDHGNQETTDASTLRLLPDKFKVQAAYVIKAKLGGVIPVEDGWSDEAVEYFQNFVEAKSLLADIVEINTDNSSCVVHLLKLGIPVHELLIEKGFATLADSSLVDTAVQRHFSDANESTIAQSGDFSYLESTHLEDDESTEQAGTCPVANRGLKIGYVSNTLEELKEVGVYVSHAVSPSLFWCQLSSSSDTLSQISQSMEIAYSSPQNEDKVEGPLSAGDIVAVVSDDGLVYRSKVLSSIDLDSSSDQKVSLRYLDYGNEREVPRDQIFKMKEELCSYPAQAIQCCLDRIQPSEDGWLPEACSKFLELVEGHELFLKLVGREQDGSVLVDLISTDSDDHVSASLIASGFGEMVSFESATGITSSSLRTTKAADTTGVDALEITQPIMESTVMPGEITQNIQQSYLFEDTENGHYRCLRLSLHTEYEVMVSNDELPNSFHVQLLEFRSQFTSLMADIAEHVVSDSNLEPSPFTPEVGACCLVQMCGVWYRGDVLSLEADNWNVKSIDCGWEVKVCQEDLKALPLRFLDLPAQAVPCYLVGIVSVEPQWCSDAIVFFQDCLKETSFCMNVLENANDGKYGVYLSDINQTGTQSINRAMVDLGYAEVVPGSNIDVQIEMEKTLDTDMLNDLEESFNEVSILKCNAHNDDDGEAEPGVILDSENTLGDTYEESELCKAITKHSVRYQEKSHGVPSSDDHYSSAASLCQPCSKSVDFDLASAVDRIDQMGCKDVYTEGGLSIVFEEYEDQSSTERTDDHSSVERQNGSTTLKIIRDKIEKEEDPDSVDKVADLNSKDKVADFTREEKVDDFISEEKVDDFISAEKVDDYTREEKVDDFTTEELNDLTGEEKVSDFTTEEKVDDLTSDEKVDDFISEEKVDDFISEEKVDDFISADKVNDYTREEKVDDLNMEEKVNDFTNEEKVDDLNSAEKVDDYTREEKVDDFTTGGKVDDLSSEEKVDYFTTEKGVKDFFNEENMDDFNSEENVEDFTREEEVDDFNTEEKLNDFTNEEKVGDFTSEEKVDDFTSEKNVENFTTEEKVDDVTSEEKVDDFTTEEKLNDFTNEEKMGDFTSEEKVDDFTTEEKVDDFTSEEKVDDFTSEEKVDDFTSEENVDDLTSEEKVDDFTSEEKVDDFTSEEKVDDFTTEEKVDDFTSDEKVDDFTSEEKVDDFTSEENVDDFTSEEKVDDFTSEEKVDDLTSEEKVDDFTSEEKVDDFTSEEKVDDFTSEEKMDDLTSEEKVDDFTSEEKVDDFTSEEKVDDFTSEEKVDDLTSEEKADYFTSEEKVDDLHSEENADDFTREEEVGDSTSAEKVNDYIREAKVDGFNMEKKVDDFTSEQKRITDEKKVGDFTTEENADDFTREKKVDGFASEENVNDYSSEEKVDNFDVISEQKVVDLTGEKKVGDLIGGKKVEDLTGEEKVEDLTGGKKVEDLTGGKKVEDLTGGKKVEDLTCEKQMDDFTTEEKGDNLTSVEKIYSITNVEVDNITSLMNANDLSGLEKVAATAEIWNVDGQAGVEKVVDLAVVKKVGNGDDGEKVDLACGKQVNDEAGDGKVDCLAGGEKMDDLAGGKQVDDDQSKQDTDNPKELESVFIQNEADVIINANINKEANILTDSKTKSLYTWKKMDHLRSSPHEDQSNEEVEHSVDLTPSSESHTSAGNSVTNACMKTLLQDVGVVENMDEETGEIKADTFQSKQDSQSSDVDQAIQGFMNLDMSSYLLDAAGQQIREKSVKDLENAVVFDTMGDCKFATALWQDDITKISGITNDSNNLLNELVSGECKVEEKLIILDSGTKQTIFNNKNSGGKMCATAASLLTNKCHEVITGLSDMARSVKLGLQIFSKCEINHLSLIHEIFEELETIELDLDLAVEQINSVLHEISSEGLTMGQTSMSNRIKKTKQEAITQSRSECSFRDASEDKYVWSGDLSAGSGEKNTNDGSTQSCVKVGGFKHFHKRPSDTILVTPDDDVLVVSDDTFDTCTRTSKERTNSAGACDYFSSRSSDEITNNNFTDLCFNEACYETGFSDDYFKGFQHEYDHSPWDRMMKCECDTTCQAENVSPIALDLTEEHDVLVLDDSNDMMNAQPRLAGSGSFGLATFYQPFPELNESGYEKSRYLHRDFGMHGLVDDRISQTDSPHRVTEMTNCNDSLPTGKEIYDIVTRNIEKKYSSEIFHSPDSQNTSTPLFGTSQKGVSAEQSSDNSEVFLDCPEPHKDVRSGGAHEDGKYFNKSISPGLHMVSCWPVQTFTYEIDNDCVEQSVNQSGTADPITAQQADDDINSSQFDFKSEPCAYVLEDIGSNSARRSLDVIEIDDTNDDSTGTDSSSSNITDTDLQTSNYDTSSLIFTESSWDTSTCFSFYSTTELEGSFQADSYMSQVLPIFESDTSDTGETLLSDVSNMGHNLESDMSNVGGTLESDTSTIGSVVPPEASHMSLELGAVALWPEGSPQNSSSAQNTSTSSYTTSSATYNESSSLDSVMNGHYGSDHHENTNGVCHDETKSSINTNTDSDIYDLRGVDIFDENDASQVSYVSQVTGETDISDSPLSDLSDTNSVESESETSQVLHPTESQAESLHYADLQAESLNPTDSQAEPSYLINLQEEHTGLTDSPAEPLHPTDSTCETVHVYGNLNLLTEHAKKAEVGEFGSAQAIIGTGILKDVRELEQDFVGTMSNTCCIEQDSITALSNEQETIQEAGKFSNKSPENLLEKQELQLLLERKYNDDTVGSDPPSFHEDTSETNQQQTFWQESKVTEEKEIIGESSDVVDFYQMDHGVEFEDESNSIQEGAEDVKGEDDDKEIQRASDVEVGEAVENKESIEKEVDL